jgi:hypothetical protein
MASETVVQQQARLAHARLPGAQNWRNNSGACTDQTGRLIRYGLGNDSAQLNAVIKSSDLIGITPVLIQPHMVGYHLGVFTALECKPSDWKMPTPIAGRDFKDQPEATQRALAQAKFHDIVRASCGYAGFVTGVPDIWRILGLHGYDD